MKVLRIVDWDRNFENNRTRELKTMSFVCVPNKHDGDGYAQLLGHENGMAHYACWILIVQVASKCDPRGTLLRDGRHPHAADSLARKTRGVESIFADAIPRLLDIGWLEYIELPDKDLRRLPQEPAEIPHPPAPSRARAERNGTGRNGTEQKNSGASGVFSKLTSGVLRDTPALSAWFEAALQKRRPVVRNTFEDRLRVFAAAERALELGDNPPAMFASIVGKGSWDLLSNAQEERARIRLKGLIVAPPTGLPTLKGISDAD